MASIERPPLGDLAAGEVGARARGRRGRSSPAASQSTVWMATSASVKLSGRTPRAAASRVEAPALATPRAGARAGDLLHHQERRAEHGRRRPRRSTAGASARRCPRGACSTRNWVPRSDISRSSALPGSRRRQNPCAGRAVRVGPRGVEQPRLVGPADGDALDVVQREVGGAEAVGEVVADDARRSLAVGAHDAYARARSSRDRRATRTVASTSSKWSPSASRTA